MELSIIIPALNEAKTIGTTLKEVCTWLKDKPFEGEVIVVVNESVDGTADIAREQKEYCSNLKVIELPKRGKGLAVQTGMEAAEGRYRLFMDADHSTTINHFDTFRPAFDEGYDVVIGSIAIKGSSVKREGREPWWRVLFGKMGNKWIQIFAVWGISDTQRGFKIFTARAAEYIFPRVTIMGWGFDFEVLALARSKGFRIKEMPVTNWDNSAESRVTLKTYFKVLMEALIVFKNRITGKYRK